MDDAVVTYLSGSAEGEMSARQAAVRAQVTGGGDGVWVGSGSDVGVGECGRRWAGGGGMGVIEDRVW